MIVRRDTPFSVLLKGSDNVSRWYTNWAGLSETLLRGFLPVVWKNLPDKIMFELWTRPDGRLLQSADKIEDLNLPQKVDGTFEGEQPLTMNGRPIDRITARSVFCFVHSCGKEYRVSAQELVTALTNGMTDLPISERLLVSGDSHR